MYTKATRGKHFLYDPVTLPVHITRLAYTVMSVPS